MMRILKSGLLLAAVTLLLPVAAGASTYTGIAVSPSNFSLSITAGPLGSASGSGAISGSATTTLSSTATSVTTTGGSGSFTVANFTAPGLALGTISLLDFAFTTTLPATTTTTGTAPTFHPDLAGTVIKVDNGFVVQGGSATLFNFSAAPTVVTAPAGSLTTLNLSTGAWTIPFTTTSTLSTLGIPVDIVIGTHLDLLQSVPEPGTMLLLGAGLSGLVALGRRKRN